MTEETPTRIFTRSESLLSPYPHCVLPRSYGDAAAALGSGSTQTAGPRTITIERVQPEQRPPRTLLTVSTWDGRSIMEVSFND